MSVAPATPPAVPVPQSAVLVLPSTGEFDSRSQRIAEGLARRGHAVTMLTRGGPDLPDEETGPGGYRVVRVRADPFSVVPLPAPLRRLTEARGWHLRGLGRRVTAVATIRAQRREVLGIAPPADVYHGMAFMGIPIALALRDRHGGRAIYDALDIYVNAGNLARLPGPLRAGLAWIERGWARRADLVLTANDGYAAVLARRFGGPAPHVVMNGSPAFEPHDHPERLFHRALTLPADERVVLYHGGLSPERGIEQLIDAIASVPRATLVLMGYGALEESLRARTVDPALGGKVRLLAAVPPVDLLRWVASADVAAMPIQPSTLNHRLTTPNKLFEAMAAGVPVLATDLPGMAAIVREVGCGLLVDPTSPAAIARCLTEMLDAPQSQRAAWRAGGMASARGRFSWETQFAALLEAYRELTGKPW